MRRSSLIALLLAGAALGSAASASGQEIENYEALLYPQARALARRTYVYESNLGRHAHGRHQRHFALRGQFAYTVEAQDGSHLTAFPATLASSADGTGDIVLLFHELDFIGWAANRDTGNLEVGRRGDSILVRYFVYRGLDSIAGPSSKRSITYAWDGGRIVASGKPPRIFGHYGPRLHLEP